MTITRDSIDLIPVPLDTALLDDSLPPATSDASSVPPMDLTPAERCDPNYKPCVPIDSDVDCAGGRGNGPSYVAGPVRVVGRDIYGLDRDHDGIGCEG